MAKDGKGQPKSDKKSVESKQKAAFSIRTGVWFNAGKHGFLL